jgi:hypothetical protein
MFAAPVPPPPKPAPQPKPVVQEEVKPPPTPPVEPINPFADWAYTGTIRMGEQTIALLENTKTKEGQYVRPGDTIMGAEVTVVTDQMVTLSAAGKPNMIAKSDNITVTQLDKSAPFLTSGGQPGQPGQPQPGQPGMPPGGFPGGRGGRGGMPPTMTPQGGQVILPNGRVLTPDQAQRRTEFLNRRFNRGQNGNDNGRSFDFGERRGRNRDR